MGMGKGMGIGECEVNSKFLNKHQIDGFFEFISTNLGLHPPLAMMGFFLLALKGVTNASTPESLAISVP